MRRLSWIEKLNRSLELAVDDATRAAIMERVGNILYSIKTEGCDCGWVRATKTPISRTLCHCGKGYIAKYFEAVFQKPVRVDVIQAAVWGDEVCRFAIYLDDEILNASGG